MGSRGVPKGRRRSGLRLEVSGPSLTHQKFAPREILKPIAPLLNRLF